MLTMDVGIALSGGGIRGIAHAGILQALEERGVKISVVSGTSAGALIGALYCAGFSPKEILEIGKANSLISLVKPVLPSKGLATLGNIVKSFSELIPHNSFEDLNLPFYVSLTNMYKGQTEYFSHGDLFKIVEASCSIPIIFKPVEINGIEYSDGGVMNNLPTEILRDKCDFLIGANLVVNPDIGEKSMNSLIKVAKRTFELQAFSNSLKSLEICDLIIMPKRLKSVGTFQAKSLDLVYEFGYKAAIDVLDAHPELIKNIVDAQ